MQWWWRRWKSSQHGQGLVEYSLTIMFIAIATLGAVAVYGSALFQYFAGITAAVAAAL